MHQYFGIRDVLLQINYHQFLFYDLETAFHFFHR